MQLVPLPSGCADTSLGGLAELSNLLPCPGCSIVVVGQSGQVLADHGIDRGALISRHSSDCGEDFFVDAECDVFHEHSLCVTVAGRKKQGRGSPMDRQRVRVGRRRNHRAGPRRVNRSNPPCHRSCESSPGASALRLGGWVEISFLGNRVLFQPLLHRKYAFRCLGQVGFRSKAQAARPIISSTRATMSAATTRAMASL